MAVDRIKRNNGTVRSVDHRLPVAGGEVEEVVGELEATGPDPILLGLDVGELLKGDEIAAPECSGGSGAVLKEGRCAVPSGGVSGEADARVEHGGAVGHRWRGVAGTVVVVVSAFGTAAGEIHEKSIAGAIRSVAGVPQWRCGIGGHRGRG